MPIEGTPLITGPSAVMARAPNPNAARLFYAWSMTAEAQQLNVDVGALRSAHPLVKDRPERKKLVRHQDPARGRRRRRRPGRRDQGALLKLFKV